MQNYDSVRGERDLTSLHHIFSLQPISNEPAGTRSPTGWWKVQNLWTERANNYAAQASISWRNCFMLKFLYVKSSRNAQVLSRCLTIGRDGKFIQNGRLRYVTVRPVREPASSQKGRATIAAKKKNNLKWTACSQRRAENWYFAIAYEHSACVLEMIITPFSW